jgi:hypothetical protein
MTPKGGNAVVEAVMAEPAAKAVVLEVMLVVKADGVSVMLPLLVITGVNPLAAPGPVIVMVLPEAVAL